MEDTNEGHHALTIGAGHKLIFDMNEDFAVHLSPETLRLRVGGPTAKVVTLRPFEFV